MASEMSGVAVGFTKCAVCKIDLKGRFVYIDDAIERILQCTKEELFGRSVLEFLDEPSRLIINELLSKRNHYESFWDSTQIALLPQDQSPTAMRAIVTLNFIAGNPVNFQLVLDALHAPDPAPAVPTDPEMSAAEFVTSVMAIEDTSDLSQYLSLLREFTDAVQATVYIIDGDRLEPRSGSSNKASVEFAFMEIPEPSEIHYRIARQGGEYQFVDETDVRDAIECDHEALSEYVVRLEGGDDSHHLLRLRFVEDIAPEAASEAIDRARFGLALWRRLLPVEVVCEPAPESSVDIKFTIGFLEHIGIGAALTDSSGQVVGYNRALLAQLNVEGLDGGHLDLAHLLTATSSHEVKQALPEFFAAGAHDLAPDLALSIVLPTEETADLTVIRLSGDPADLSMCFVVRPCGGDASSQLQTTSLRFWQEIIHALKSSLGNVTRNAQNLSHELHNQFGDVGNRRLKSIHKASRSIEGTLKEVSELIRETERDEAFQMTDLDMLVGQVLAEVRHWYPDQKVRFTHDKLPKLATHRRKLRTVLRNLFANALRFSNQSTIKIAVKAESLNDEKCVITVSDNGIGIPTVHLVRVFEYGYRVPGGSGRRCPGTGMGLSLSRQLLRGVGGDLSLESEVDTGTTARINIPVATLSETGESISDGQQPD